MLDGFVYLTAALSLSLADHFLYRPRPLALESIRRWLECRDREFLRLLACHRRRSFSMVAAFLSSWLYILFALALCREQVLLAPLGILIVASRLRALQEISHFAVHGTLYSGRRLSFLLADILFHYPLARPGSIDRFALHVEQHHRHSNGPRDPNVEELTRAGLAPSLTSAQFWRLLLHPMTPSALRRSIVKKAAIMTAGGDRSIGRWLCFSAAMVLAWAVGGWTGLLAVYVPSALVIYPQLAWLSQLIEHRWLAPRMVPVRASREYTHGRVTDFPGLAGGFVRAVVLPYGDSYHLAHSLYPFVSWHYLPAVDRVLKELDPLYAEGCSTGLFRGRAEEPAAIDVIRHFVHDPARCPASSDGAVS